MRPLEKTKNYVHNVGEIVVYRKQGTYEITEIKEQKIGSVKKDYYVLSSVYDKNAAVYVPVDNEALTSQIQRILSKAEIDTIIDESKENPMEWIENNAERAVLFEEIMKSGELLKILAVLNMFLFRKENVDKKCYRTFARDEKAFAAAQKTITEAFAYPLGLEKTEVIPYITERTKNNK